MLLIIAVTLLGGALAQAASYRAKNGKIVDPIINSHTNSPRSYSGNNLVPLADLYRANLTDAVLTDAILTDATFSAGTILPSGLTVMQHGLDAAGLQAYLEGAPIYAGNADIQLVLFLLLGDANNDNQATGADLVIVQQNFGNTLAPVGEEAPVPQ